MHQQPLPHPLTVDRTRSLEQMVAAGHYDWVDTDITAKHFPANGADIRGTEPLLVHFDRRIIAEAAKEKMEEWGLRPADLTELLALGADPHYRDLQRDFPVVELASVWSPRSRPRYVADLYGHAIGRVLNLYWYEGDWPADFRFLAFRKS